jgi:LPXTG-motif cell wall-anchored protein
MLDARTSVGAREAAGRDGSPSQPIRFRPEKGDDEMNILIIVVVLILLFGGGGYYWRRGRN